MSNLKGAVRIAVIYLIAGVCWILFSDLLVSGLNLEQQSKTIVEMVKGILFVLISSLIFFYFLKGADFKSLRGKLFGKDASYLAEKGLPPLSRKKDWFDPVLLISIFVLIFGLFLWLLYLDSQNSREVELDADARSAKENIKMRLHSNEQYLKMFASERGAGILDSAIFRERVSQFMAAHSELTTIKWVDSNFTVSEAVPQGANSKINGLKIELPEPRRAAGFAKKTRRPLYTAPFEYIDGKPSFEFWVPVFANERFLGFFVGVYSCEEFIYSVLHNHILEHNYVSLHNKEGAILASTKLTGSINYKLVRKILLDLPGNGVYIQLQAYHSGYWNWIILFFGLLSLGLLIALGYGVWLLKKDMNKRMLAEQALMESERKFRLLYETMAQGVVYQDTDGKIIDANPAAQEMFGLSLDQMQGRTSIDPLWRAIREDGSDFHSSEYPAMVALATGREVKDVLMGVYNPAIDEYKWILVNATPQFQEGESKPAGVFSAFIDITHRKKMEESLAASEMKYRFFFENSMDAILLTTPDGGIISANPAACNMFGRSEEEIKMIGRKGIVDLNDPRLPIFIAERELLGKARGELNFVRKDGSRFPAEIASAIFLNDKGEPRASIIIRDITDRKEAEEALLKAKLKAEESEKAKSVLLDRLNEAQRSAKIGSWDWDLITNKVWWSEELYRIFELNPAEFTPDMETISKSLHPDDNEPYNKEVARVIKYGGELNYDFRVITPIGRIKYCNCRAKIERDQSGNPLRFFGTIADISERKKAEDEINDLNDKLFQLINAVKELSSAHSIEMVQNILSKSARKLTSADGATVVLREGDYCYYADEDAIEPLWKGKKFPLNSCISGWAMLNRESAVIYDIYSDERIPIEAYRPTFVKSLAMVPIVTKEPLGAIGNYWKDHYMPTQIEVQLLQTLADAAARAIENVRLYEELEERVKMRTVQLDAINKELEAFSYSVSHDLRAPLRHISGYVDLLLNRFYQALPDKGKHYLNNIADAAHQMGTLIDDLLEFSRAGRKEMKKSNVDMNQVLNEALNHVSRDTAERQIEWQIAELPKVYGDHSLLRVVWINLIGNAVKFTRKTSKSKIEIGSYRDKNEIVFFVKDNGVGFDMNYSHKLFGVFQRLHSTDEFEGTGIGLANVQRIISKHGGRVRAESELNKGSTFYFSLPINMEGIR